MLPVLQLKSEQFFDKKVQLRQKSIFVTDFDEQFQKEIDEIIETFHNWKIAVGLSAPQIGIKKRFAIINISKEKSETDLIIVNPIITNQSGKKDMKKESCLSLPNIRGPVERRFKIALSYQDRTGAKQSLTAEGFFARVILHEIDHLDGILFVDRMVNVAAIEPLNITWE